MSPRQEPAEKLHCVLHCQSDEAHLQQVYAGFATLARNGAFTLEQKLEKIDFYQALLPGHLDTSRAAHLIVEVDGMRIGYDVHDAGEVPEDLLAKVDVLFKRSWELAFVEACTAPRRVLPLGANLWVHANPPDWRALGRARMYRGSEALKRVVRALGMDRLLGNAMFTPRWADLSAKPPIDLAPRVLFLAEAWNPDEAPTEHTATERVSINAARAACMRALRERFGDKATCGFRNTPFAQREFADLVVNDSKLTRKRSYLKLVRQHPICIATSGLHRSTGWKFAEYLAMSRAIVSEKLHMQLPGPIAAESHYLEFSGAESCVAAVARLFDDAGQRQSLMKAAAAYATHHVRPDSLIAESLRHAFAWRETNRSAP
ncbi:MAG: hypothetical protein WBP11_06210 [Dokdonella sp.]